MTYKERILMAARGEMPDTLPYVPRFDLWYNANSWSDTLPQEHKGRTADEIARAEGWALHKVVPELLKVESAEENLHRGLGLSALLTTTMPEMKKIINTLTEKGLRDKVKVIVGGAPVIETYAQQIGADGYAADAGASIDLAKKLLD